MAERTGVYTAFDYADIMDHLIKRWDVPTRTNLSTEALAAQEYLCVLPNRIRKLAERANGEGQGGRLGMQQHDQQQYEW